MMSKDGWRDTGRGYQVRKIKRNGAGPKGLTPGNSGLTGQARKAAKNIKKSANRAKKY